MANDTRYGILDLVQASGVNRRTIRYYVQMGLLPPPEGAGRGHYYLAEHLERLGRIREMQDDGRSLREIAVLLEGGPRPADEIPVPPPEIATHLKLAPGVELIVSHGVEPPSPSQIRALAVAAARIISKKEQP